MTKGEKHMSDQAKMGLTWASPMQQARNAANQKPMREWQGLTDDECLALWGESRWWITEREVIANARAIEAKLKEKNA